MAKNPRTPPPAMEPGALSGPLRAAMARSLPPWSPKAFGALILMVLLVWAAVTMLGRVQYLLWWSVIAAFLYFAMAPAVDWLAAHKVKRGIGAGLVLLVLIASIVGLLAAMTPLIVSETESAINDAPAMLKTVSDLGTRFGVTIDVPSTSGGLQNALTALKGHLPDVAGGALSVTSALIGALFEFFVVLLFTFFLLANQDRFRHFVLSLLRPNTQNVVGQAWDLAVYKTGGYLYSRILTATLAGTVVGVTLYFLDCPYPLALAIWYGIVSQFLPMVGTYIAAALPLLILLIRNPLHAVIFLAVLAAWIPLQDYVIGPKVSAETMALAPASALAALLAGGALFGPLGAFLALPAAAVIQSVATAFFPRHPVGEAGESG